MMSADREPGSVQRYIRLGAGACRRQSSLKFTLANCPVTTVLSAWSLSLSSCSMKYHLVHIEN